MLDTMEKLAPAEEADIVLLIGKEREAWMKDFLAALRSRPRNQTLAERLAPHLDKLWDQHLGPVIKEHLENHLHPPVNPAEHALVVNGSRVSRRLVDFVRHVGVPLPGSASKEPAGDEWNIARRDVLRMGLVHQAYVLKGNMIDADKMEASFRAYLPPGLKDADDSAFLKTCGMNKNEAISMYQLNLVLGEMLQQSTRSLPMPTEEEVNRWTEDHGQGLGDEFHLHRIRLPWPDDNYLSGKYLVSRRARALRSALLAGFPETLLPLAAKVDGETMVEYTCIKSIAAHALMPSITEGLAGVPEGGWSMPLAENGKYTLLQLVKRTPGKIPDGEYGKMVLQGRARRHQQMDALAKWFDQLESQATVEWVDGPRPDAESEKARALEAAKEWADSAPASALASLIHLWLLLPGKDDAAIHAALDKVLATALTPEDRKGIAEAFAEAGHRDLAAKFQPKEEEKR
jgi:hypothetical protein